MEEYPPTPQNGDHAAEEDQLIKCVWIFSNAQIWGISQLANGQDYRVPGMACKSEQPCRRDKAVLLLQVGGLTESWQFLLLVIH